ncbi:hypothetical protein BLA29_010041, partial [Euroglyphus maynei]
PIHGRLRDLKYRAGKRHRLKVINDTNNIDENDSKQSTSGSELSLLDQENSKSTTCNSSFFKRPKNPNKKSLFILDEADVIDDSYDTQPQTQVENSDDREFIDDDGDVTDENLDHTGDSIYLKTTKNLIGPQNKYKLKYDYDRNLEVNSQRYGSIYQQDEEDEEDEYQMDSFCNDEIIHISDSDEDHHLIMEKTPSKNSKRLLKNKQISSTPINPVKKRRRIIMEDDDDD